MECNAPDSAPPATFTVTLDDVNTDPVNTAAPVVKKEAPDPLLGGGTVEASAEVVVSSSPQVIVKTEPEIVVEESETTAGDTSDMLSMTSSFFNSSSEMSDDNPEVPPIGAEKVIGSTSDSALTRDPWSSVKTVKEEPDVVIDRDEVDPRMSDIGFPGLLPSTPPFQGPRPVMMVKRKSPTTTPTPLAPGAPNPMSPSVPSVPNGPVIAKSYEERDVDWLRMLNGKSHCLVCNGPCTITKNRKIPSLPFCKKCKKAYFYQLNHMDKQRRHKNVCLRGGTCVIDYQQPKLWCPVCHLSKFRTILKSKGATITEDDKDLEPSSDRIEAFRQKYYLSPPHRKRSRSESEGDSEASEAAGTGSESESSKMLPREPVIKVKKLTDEDLKAYGISLPLPEAPPVKVKDEPIESNWFGSESDTSPANTPSSTPESNASSSNSSPFQSHSLFTSKMRQALKPKFVPRIAVNSKPQAPKPQPPKPQPPKPQLPKPQLPKPQPPKPQPKPKLILPPKPKSPPQMPSDGVASIKVYIFTCGHACGVCNSGKAKEWLNESGIHASPPLSENGSSVHKKTPNPNQMFPSYITTHVTKLSGKQSQQQQPLSPNLRPAPSPPSLPATNPQLKRLLEKPPDVRLNVPVPSYSVPKTVVVNPPPSLDQLPQFSPQAIPFRPNPSPIEKTVSSVPTPIQLLPVPLSTSGSSFPSPVQLLRVPTIPPAGSVALSPASLLSSASNPSLIPPIPALLNSSNTRLPSSGIQQAAAGGLASSMSLSPTSLAFLAANIPLRQPRPASFNSNFGTSTTAAVTPGLSDVLRKFIAAKQRKPESTSVSSEQGKSKPSPVVSGQATRETRAVDFVREEGQRQVVFPARMTELFSVSLSSQVTSTGTSVSSVPPHAASNSSQVTGEPILDSFQIKKEPALDSPQTTTEPAPEATHIKTEPGLDSSQMKSEPEPVSPQETTKSFFTLSPPQEMTEPRSTLYCCKIPALGSSLKTTESVLDSSLETTESALDPSEKTTESVLDSSQKTTESALDSSQMTTESVLDPSQKTTESVLDPSQKITESALDSSQKTTESVLDSSQKTIKSEFDSSQKTTESIMDSSQKTTESILDSSQKTTESLLDSSQKTIKSEFDSSQKTTESILDSSQKTTESILDSSQKTTESILDPSQKTNTPVSNSDSQQITSHVSEDSTLNSSSFSDSRPATLDNGRTTTLPASMLPPSTSLPAK